MDDNEFYHHYRAHYFCSCVLQNIQKGLIMSSQACTTILLLLRDNTFNNKASLLFFHFHNNLFSVFSLPWVFLISPLFLVSQAGYGKCELNIGFGAHLNDCILIFRKSLFITLISQRHHKFFMLFSPGDFGYTPCWLKRGLQNLK